MGQKLVFRTRFSVWFERTSLLLPPILSLKHFLLVIIIAGLIFLAIVRKVLADLLVAIPYSQFVMATSSNKQNLVRARAQQYAQSKYLESLVSNERREEKESLSIPTTSSSANVSSSSDPTERILNKLTQKLTSHLREELRREVLDESLTKKEVCDTIVSRIDNFVQNELSSFSCPICFEIMSPPDRSPILLFPCGHSFCETCINSHLASLRKTSHRANSGNCPFCR